MNDPAPAPLPRPAWWVRLLSLLPLPVLHAALGVLAWLASTVIPYRRELILDSLARAFPDRSPAEIRSLMRAYYRGFTDVFAEIVKTASIDPEDLEARVEVHGLELPRQHLDAGQPVLLVAAHQCNWEWMLHALALKLGYPLDGAYKPLATAWADREMLAIRSRFGSRLVPAKDLLADIIRQKGRVRGIAVVADQEPRSAEHKHWTTFLNRDTAFYMGPEQIARVTKYPAYFVGMRRTGSGRYEMHIGPALWTPGEKLAPGEFTERYVRLVEQQIHADPADWTWSHKRWKLKKPLYGAKG